MNGEMHERKVRHIMCTLMALETLLVLLLFELLGFDKGDTLKMAYFHEYTLSEILLFFFIFAVPITCTILSARFQTFYCFYESLHCLLGGALLLFSLFSPAHSDIITGIVLCFILSIRFIIYIFTVKNC